jgi:hypothetical protein
MLGCFFKAYPYTPSLERCELNEEGDEQYDPVWENAMQTAIDTGEMDADHTPLTRVEPALGHTIDLCNGCICRAGAVLVWRD